MTPAFCGEELDGGKIVFRSFVVARCYATELFDPVEEALDEVSLPIKPGREDEACLAIGLRRDIGPSFSFGRLCPDGVAVIAFVGQQDVALAEIVRQGIGLGAVGDLPSGQAKLDGTTFGVDERMDLAREPATRTSHASIVSIPLFPVAACWWTRTQVASIITMSPS